MTGQFPKEERREKEGQEQKPEQERKKYRKVCREREETERSNPDVMINTKGEKTAISNFKGVSANFFVDRLLKQGRLRAVILCKSWCY